MLSEIYSVKPRLKISRLFLALLIVFVVVLATGTFAVQSNDNLAERIALWQVAKDGRYLVLFQNNAELRPTGGFIGSYAAITIKDKKVANFDFETNIYKKDNLFVNTHTITPPTPIVTLLGQPKWSLHDANWAADFPEAVRTILWFYHAENAEYAKNTGQPELGKIDGVFTLDTNVLADILRLTGPIEMPEYNLTVNFENFMPLVQYQVEKGYWQKEENRQINEPKTILKDLLPRILTRLDESSNLNQIFDLVENDLNKKHILLYFNDPELQKIASEKNWTGEIPKVNSDYLYLNEANLGVNKSSLNIKETVNLKVQDYEKEKISELTISRSHIGSYEWPDGPNKSYLRILVPAGSQLIKVSLDETDITNKVEISTEKDKTSFGLPLVLQPKTSRILKVSYKPNFEAKNYSLYLQKQPGKISSETEVIYGNKVLFNGLLEKDKIVQN